jgi:hypothetical protein
MTVQGVGEAETVYLSNVRVEDGVDAGVARGECGISGEEDCVRRRGGEVQAGGLC